jgi:hypothetical protein
MAAGNSNLSIPHFCSYCKEANSFGALMFSGKWGCGKTYLIWIDKIFVRRINKRIW